MATCDYCQEPARLRTQGGRHYWSCARCQASVMVLQSSVRTGQYLPMGRLLKADGQKLKKHVLRRFKRIWIEDVPALGKSAARNKAYAWLARKLGTRVHIDQLDVPDLLRVVAALKEYGSEG